MHANTDTELSHVCTLHILHDDAIRFTLMNVVSLNNCSKLKGQYTDIKNGYSTSVQPSLDPHSLI